MGRTLKRVLFFAILALSAWLSREYWMPRFNEGAALARNTPYCEFHPVVAGTRFDMREAFGLDEVTESKFQLLWPELTEDQIDAFTTKLAQYDIDYWLDGDTLKIPCAAYRDLNLLWNVTSKTFLDLAANAQL